MSVSYGNDEPTLSLRRSTLSDSIRCNVKNLS